MERPAGPRILRESTSPFVGTANENEIRSAHVFELHIKPVREPLPPRCRRCFSGWRTAQLTR